MIVIAPEEQSELVDLLYSAVFRRPADEAGKRGVLQLLASNGPTALADLLRGAMASHEFRTTRLVPAHVSLAANEYDPARDGLLAAYGSPEVQARSEYLRTAQPIGTDRYDAGVAETVERFGVEVPNLLGQDQYLATHRERFRELNNIAAVLVGEAAKERSSIIDVGFSINSMLLQGLLPEATVHVMDRFEGEMPPSMPGKGYTVDLTSAALDTLDLGVHADVILFAEVIEHLVANPVRVLAFLVRHLNEGGRLVVTTPNFYRRDILEKIARRDNPQFVLPAAAMPDDLPHYHVREYAMRELLWFANEAGGRVEAFFYSPCWDDPELRDKIPPHEWGNMVVVIARP